MTIRVNDKFIALSPEDTRCPAKIAAIAPSARKIYILKERFDCSHWDHVRDCFHQVKGSYIVTKPTAGRRHFTLQPGRVIARLCKARVW